MGVLVSSAVDRLPLPDHPDLWVEMKREATYADELYVEQRRQEIMGRAAQNAVGEPLIDARLVAEFVVVKVAVVVSAWNLSDDEGEPLPVTTDSIARLKPAAISFLSEQARARLAGRSVEEERPFVKRSQRPSSTARKSATR